MYMNIIVKSFIVQLTPNIFNRDIPGSANYLKYIYDYNWHLNFT